MTGTETTSTDTTGAEVARAGMKRRTVLRRVVSVAALLVVLAGTFLAGRASVSSVRTSAAADLRTSVAPAIWTVAEEQVGRSLTFLGRVRTASAPGPMSSIDGIVTSVAIAAPDTIDVGTELYSVGLRPVVAGQGSVPGFRDLAVGDRGADVVQVRALLCDVGWEQACGASAVFDDRLQAAVRSWQEESGVAPDGVVRSGDILWFPALPVRVRPAEVLAPGNAVAPTDRPFTVDAGTISFELAVSREQAALVPVGTRAVLGGELEATVARIVPVSAAEGTTEQETGAGEFLIELAAVGSTRPLCEVETFCAETVGDQESASVEVMIFTVPEQLGPAVPVAAIQTDAGGRTTVLTVDDRRVEVTVVAVAGGVAVVEGLAVGDQVVLP